jgi:hypothetical protein
MPQFDFYSFSGQVFWTLLGFSFFYFFILKYYLVSFSEIFKIRQKLHNKIFLLSDINLYQKKIYTAFI